MANKYIYQGSTFCGDGTASNEAASAGAAGAWNNINVLEGTAPAYGTAPAAGDVVYIRSKDAAGANITRTLSASVTLGLAASTDAAPITWIVDGGLVWSGVSGVITYDCASGNAAINIKDFNRLHAQVKFSLVFKITQANFYASFVMIYRGVFVSNVLINAAAVTLTNNGPGILTIVTYQYAPAILRGCKVRVGNSIPTAVISVSDNTRLILDDVEVEYTTAGLTAYPLFSLGGNNVFVSATGFRVTGQTANVALRNNPGSGSLSNGLELLASSIPGNMAPLPTALTALGAAFRTVITGCDGGFGAYKMTYGGVVDSRQDGYYPSLNGTYPNSGSSGWSWKVYPQNASTWHPCEVVASKAYTQADSVKTITVEFLAASGLAAKIVDGQVWVDICYIDTSGVMQTMSSFVGNGSTAIPASTAPWSAVTYGATLLNKHKIVLTTPTAIKQDTVVSAIFRCSAKASVSTEVLFVDPDPQLT